MDWQAEILKHLTPRMNVSNQDSLRVTRVIYKGREYWEAYYEERWGWPPATKIRIARYPIGTSGEDTPKTIADALERELEKQ